jgi:2'-5' RNA ligase
MTVEHAARLRDHWWPRPGWRPGRIIYTWHLTFEDAKDLHRLVAVYQSKLAPLPGLNAVPLEWLHLTIQGVGYTDEVSDHEISSVAEAVRTTVAEVPAFELTFGRPVIYGEAIAIRPDPAEPLQALLQAIRAGIAAATGPESIRTGPEQASGFHPHMSIAYSNTDSDAAPYVDALNTVSPAPAVVPVTAVALIRQGRQLEPDRLYYWTVRDIARLGNAAHRPPERSR